MSIPRRDHTKHDLGLEQRLGQLGVFREDVLGLVGVHLHKLFNLSEDVEKLGASHSCQVCLF